MTTKARAALQRKIVQLERNAVAMERFYHELQGAAPSARTTRHLRANRKAVEALVRDLHTARKRLGIRPTDTDLLPPDSRVHASR